MSDANASIPIIDFSGWLSGSTEDRQKTARQLIASFQGIGFAYITGHGVPQSAVAEIFGASRQFFAQSPQQLEPLHYRNARNYHGYVPKGTLLSTGAFHEIFDCGMETPGEYHGKGEEIRNTPNLWPSALPGFRGTVERYQIVMKALADALLAAIATGIGLPTEFFADRCALPHAQLRLLHYLPRPGRARSVSVGRHCDYEAVTILAQDDVGGLQVRDSAGRWTDIRPVEGAFLINVGEMLARWTNGVVPATPHRVLTPSSRERYSVAFFYGTGYDVLIEPVLAPADGAARYEPMTGGEHLHLCLTEHGL